MWRRSASLRQAADRRLDDSVSIHCDALGDFYVPHASAKGPAVVILHGCAGIKEDMTQLAYALACSGASVCNASWRCARTGDTVDKSIGDISRSVVAAQRRFERPVKVVAWSDAALAAFVACVQSSDAVAAFLGISGYYGWPDERVPADLITERTIRYFGSAPSDDPALWNAANPYTHLSRDPGWRSELIVGSRDQRVQDATRFYIALRAAGFATHLVIVPEAGPYDLVIPRHPLGRNTVERIVAPTDSGAH